MGGFGPPGPAFPEAEMWKIVLVLVATATFYPDGAPLL